MYFAKEYNKEMSDNSVLLIKYRKPSYFVDKYGVPVGNAKTLEKAVRLANKYLNENLVEYGIQIKMKSEKRFTGCYNKRRNK